jgi:hypothetical protein
MPKILYDPNKPNRRPHDWPSFLRRYVWDETKTPYFTATHKLTREQADSELLIWSGFVAVFGCVLAMALLSGKLPGGPAPVAGAWATVVVCAAIIMGVTKLPAAAAICTSGPALLAIKTVGAGVRQGQSQAETIVMCVLFLLFFAYALRAMRICQRYVAAL